MNRNLGFAVILRAKPTLYDKWFARYEIWQNLRILDQFGPKKWCSPMNEPDHQVNLKNTLPKLPKTVVETNFREVGPSPPFLYWSIFVGAIFRLKSDIIIVRLERS